MQLLITGPDGSPTTVQLHGKPLSLGRAADNDLAYPSDPALSRYHLRIEPIDEGWSVRDCGSRNGTLVDGAALTEPKRLLPGNRIYAGQLTIDVRDHPGRVTFVSQDSVGTKRSSTIVTSLDEVLGRTNARGSAAKESKLTSARVVSALIRAGQELAGHRPLGELFGVILDLALAAVNAKRGVILTLESDHLEVRATRGDGFSISTSVRDQVLTQRASLVISDALSDSGFREQRSIVLQRVRSLLAVPLQTGGRAIGLLYVDNGTIVRPFSHEDLELLTVMANVAAIRIEHARLAAIEQQERVLQAQLEQASEIQQGLLPAEPPVCEGYEFAGYNLACQSVGGDYYDFLTYSDGRIGLLVADVCGKGMSAALVMSSLQARVQMLIESRPGAAEALNKLNRNLAPRFPIGRFITVFLALLDPATGVLQYANAGHNYPLLLRRDGTVERLRSGGMVMGLVEDIQYQEDKITLEAGETLVLYSDGVTEAVDESQQQFGEQRLADFLAPRRNEPCKELVSALVDHVRSWSGTAAFADDFTAVFVRRS